MLKEKIHHYHSYLLRIWRDDADSGWYALLEDPGTGQTHGFSSLSALFQFLEGITQPDSPAQSGPMSV